jgi:hypothetical protein
MAKLVIESYGAFLNEAKKKKTKKESFISKSDINKALKDLGFGLVKMGVDSYREKTHPSKQQGLRGGSIGPMTATTAYRGHNNEALDRVKRKLVYELGGKEIDTYADLSVAFPSKKGELVYTFIWQLFPTYAGNDYDRGYQSYWLTYRTEEREVIEEGVTEAYNFITFSIDDEKLDDLLHKQFSKALDYFKEGGDEFYTLPQREFDRFIDAADSKGFDVDYEDSEESVLHIHESELTMSLYEMRFSSAGVKELLSAIYYNWDKLKKSFKEEHHFNSFKDVLDFIKGGDQEEQRELEDLVKKQGIELITF